MLPAEDQHEAELQSPVSAVPSSPAAVNGLQNGHGSHQRVVRGSSPLFNAAADSPAGPAPAIALSAAFTSTVLPPSPSKPTAASGLLRPLLQPRTFLQKCATLALCVIGIYVCFISYGLLQERMSAAQRQPAACAACCSRLTACHCLRLLGVSYKQQYGPEQEKFNHASVHTTGAARSGGSSSTGPASRAHSRMPCRCCRAAGSSC